MIKLLHFADAHIDIANYGAHDPRTGLPLPGPQPDQPGGNDEDVVEGEFHEA